MRLQIHTAKIEVEPEHPVLLVTGDGRSLLDDLNRFGSWGIEHDVMAIGRSMTAYPGRVLHWANVDGADSVWWAEHLPLKNDGKFPIRHTLGDCRGYDVDWDIVDEVKWNREEVLWHGSTALFAVYTALAMGYQNIILAGCPLDSKGHWFYGDSPENTGPVWTGYSYQAWLEFAKDPEASRVRSLSGYTAQIIGLAERSWIDAGESRKESGYEGATESGGDCRTSS